MIGAAGYSSHPSSCHAAHASSRSFKGSKIPSKKSSISVLSISSGYSFVSRPGIYTFTRKHVKVHLKIFFAENKGFYSEGCTGSTSGRARCNLSRCRTKMAETLVFLREFRSLTAGPAAHPELQVIPASRSGYFFGSFREFLRSFGEL